MNFFNRATNDSLFIRSLDLQIFFGDMFSICKSEEEVEWIVENLQGIIEMASEERIEEIN